MQLKEMQQEEWLLTYDGSQQTVNNKMIPQFSEKVVYTQIGITLAYSYIMITKPLSKTSKAKTKYIVHGNKCVSSC